MAILNQQLLKFAQPAIKNAQFVPANQFAALVKRATTFNPLQIVYPAVYRAIMQIPTRFASPAKLLAQPALVEQQVIVIAVKRALI